MVTALFGVAVIGGGALADTNPNVSESANTASTISSTSQEGTEPAHQIGGMTYTEPVPNDNGTGTQEGWARPSATQQGNQSTRQQTGANAQLLAQQSSTSQPTSQAPVATGHSSQPAAQSTSAVNHWTTAPMDRAASQPTSQSHQLPQTGNNASLSWLGLGLAALAITLGLVPQCQRDRV